MNKHSVYVTIALTSILAGPLSAQTTPSTAPDNARSNRIDASNATATSDAQANTATDVALTKRIRQSLMADKSLSTYAHNVKIVSSNGSVTLNGVVRSEDEKTAIEAKAADIVGRNKVTDDLKVASGQ